MVQRVRKLAVKLLMILLVVCSVIGIALAFTGCATETKGVKSFTINADGELVVTYTDDSTDILGKVVGESGKQIESAEINENGELEITYTDGTTTNVGKVTGSSNGIASIVLSEDGKSLIITLSDGTKLDPIAIPEFDCKHEGDYDLIEIEKHSLKLDADEDPVLDENGDPVYNNGTYLKVYKECGHSEVIYDVIHDEKTLVEEEVPATCTEDAVTKVYCPECGYVASETVHEGTALGHDFSVSVGFIRAEGQTICEDGGVEIIKCSRCEERTHAFTEAVGHHSASWTLTTGPGEKTKGVLTGKCEICGGAAVTMEIPALYKLDEDGEIVKDADGNPVVNEAYAYELTTPKTVCTEEGLETFTYTVPAYEGLGITTPEQKIEIEVELPSTNHMLGGKAVINDNLTHYVGKVWNGDDGYNAFDGYAIEVGVLKSLNEKNGEYLGYEANCKGAIAGMGYYYCEDCDTLQPIYTYKAHTYDKPVEGTYKAPTCEDAGQQKIECSVCQQVVTQSGDQALVNEMNKDQATNGVWEYSEKLKALGHAWKWELEPVAGGAENVFDLVGTCTRCDAVAEEADGAVEGITNPKPIAKTEATCEKEGTITYEYTSDKAGTVRVTVSTGLAPHTLYIENEGAENEKKVTIDSLLVNNAIDITKYAEYGVKEYLGYESSCKTDAIDGVNPGPDAEGKSQGTYKYGQGYYTCAECGEAQPVTTYRTHTYESIKVTKEPTCTANGEGEFDCTTCGTKEIKITGDEAAKYDELKALGHDIAYKLTENTISSDEDDFYLTVYCRTCNVANSALGDEYKEYGVDGKLVKGEKVAGSEKIPSCDADEPYGTVDYKVKLPDGTEQTIPVTTKRVYHTLAGKEFTNEYTTADAIDINDEKYAGLVKEYKGYESSCASTATNEINPGPNAQGEAQGTYKYGRGYYKCEKCGEEQPVVTYRSHTYTEEDITENVAPTCTENGHVTYTCAVCDETRTDYIAAKGHDLVIGEVTAPTDAAPGSAQVKCSVAGCTWTATYNLPALKTADKLTTGYTLVKTEAATCEAEGYSDYKYVGKITYEAEGVDKTGAETSGDREFPIEVSFRVVIPMVDHKLDDKFEEIYVEEQEITYVGKWCKTCGNFIVAADGIIPNEEVEVTVGEKDYEGSAAKTEIVNNDTVDGWWNGNTSDIAISDGQAVVITWTSADSGSSNAVAEVVFNTATEATTDDVFLTFNPTDGSAWKVPKEGEKPVVGTVTTTGTSATWNGDYKAVIAKVGTSVVMTIEFTAAGSDTVTVTRTVTFTDCSAEDAVVHLSGNPKLVSNIVAYVGTLTEVVEAAE